MDVLIVIGIMFAIILAIFLLCCFKDFLEHHEKVADVLHNIIAISFVAGFAILILLLLFVASHHIAVCFNWIEPFLK